MEMRKIMTIATALTVCAASFGQNINPTVEVTNIYQGNPSEVHKPQTDMAIPDSLLRFDMDFYYEVFEKPYQGAYNFKPYMLAMKPDKDAYRGKSLYLRAGAGYSLHPQLDFVFSPEWNGPLQLSVFAGNRSYFGKYHTLGSVLDRESDLYRIEKVSGKGFNGYDSSSSVGFDGRFDYTGGFLTFGAGYTGLHVKDSLTTRSFNAVDFNVRARPNRNENKYIFYDVAVSGRFGGDRMYSYHLNEGIVRLVGNVGPVLDENSRALLGFELESVSYSRMFKENAGRVAIIPKYVFQTGQWDLSLGVKVDKLFGGSETPGTEQVGGEVLHTYRGNWFFPDVHVSFAPSGNVLLYASATGGNKVNTYSSMLERNHFWRFMERKLDNSVENINAKVGVKGKVGNLLQFDVDGGAAVYANGVVDTYQYPLDLLPMTIYQDYSLIYADALLGLTYGNLKVDAGLHFRNMAFKEDMTEGILLPKFTCDAKAVYDVNSRVYAGMRIVASSSRSGQVLNILSSEMFP